MKLLRITFLQMGLPLIRNRTLRLPLILFEVCTYPGGFSVLKVLV